MTPFGSALFTTPDVTIPNRGVKVPPGVVGKSLPLMLDAEVTLSSAAYRVSSIKASRANDLPLGFPKVRVILLIPLCDGVNGSLPENTANT